MVIFIVWIAFIGLKQKSKLESHKKVCENKSDKTPSISYADLESLIRKVNRCKIIFEKSSPTKMGEHIPCRYSLSVILISDGIENNHVYITQLKTGQKSFLNS